MLSEETVENDQVSRAPRLPDVQAHKPSFSTQLLRSQTLPEHFDQQTFNKVSRMCAKYQTRYTCPGHPDCTYTRTAWSTHCDATGLDNMHGRCSRQHWLYGGWRTMSYPCPEHQGLRDANAEENIRRDGRDQWRNAPDTGRGSRGTNSSAAARLTERLREVWLRNPGLYERDAEIRERMAEMKGEEWQEHFNRDVFMRSANERFGAEYWRDPQPWGRWRPGGRLMSPNERLAYMRSHGVAPDESNA